eukprot:5522232-Alexandrium_andersonii.AAC.1
MHKNNSSPNVFDVATAPRLRVGDRDIYTRVSRGARRKWTGGKRNQRVTASDWRFLLNATTVNCGGPGLP